MGHKVVWFDIPAADFERARQFYAEVLDLEVREEFQNVGVFASNEGEVSGCIYLSKEETPRANGPLLYLNVNGRLDDAIEKAYTFGGRVIKGKHPIGPFGHRAIIQDSEGNRIALHSE